MSGECLDVTMDNQPPHDDVNKENAPRNPRGKRARISNQSDLLEDVTEQIMNVVEENTAAQKMKKRTRLEIKPSFQARTIDKRVSSDIATWNLQSGCLMRIVLRNFLCHHELVYVPHERINFISGLNGSGKLVK
jgi:hypothetical protein